MSRGVRGGSRGRPTHTRTRIPPPGRTGWVVPARGHGGRYVCGGSDGRVSETHPTASESNRSNDMNRNNQIQALEDEIKLIQEMMFKMVDIIGEIYDARKDDEFVESKCVEILKMLEGE